LLMNLIEPPHVLLIKDLSSSHTHNDPIHTINLLT
jgi:hypothetical protein